MHSRPLAYFLTFRTYGTWLPGDTRGYTHHTPDERGVKGRTPTSSLRRHAETVQLNDALILDDKLRTFIDETVREACQYREWNVLALNVRSNHVHLVVASDRKPEYVLRTVKARVTRCLREASFVGTDSKVWSRHGSTIHLFTEAQVNYAVWYTNEAQDGERFELPDNKGDERAPA